MRRALGKAGNGWQLLGPVGVDLYGTTIVWSKAIGSGRVVLFEVEEPKKELTGVVMAETAKAR